MEPEVKRITFWCETDREDFELEASRLYQNSVVGYVWKVTCPLCGRHLIRLINDAKRDPYFRLSHRVASERRKYAKDLLQPGDPMFDIIYPEHKKKQLEAEDKKARELWEQERQR